MKKKEKEQTKLLSHLEKIELSSLIIIVLMLGITLPIHFCIKAFNWYWVIFVWMLILIPTLLINFKVYAESNNNFTEEQKKNGSNNIGLYMLWYWYLDFVYMVIFNNWKIAIFIMVGFALIKILVNVTSIFLSNTKKEPFIRQSLLVDFLAAIGLSVYLINLIQNQNLQTIVTAIAASLLGGLLTLVGVAWTIKDANETRKQDEIQKSIPLFSYNMLKIESRFGDTIQKVCSTKIEEEYKFKCGVCVELENSNRNSFVIKRVFHDDKWFEVEGNTVVLPSNKCLLAFNFSDKPENIFLEVEDELFNNHYYQLKVLFLGCKTSNDELFHTVREIVKVNNSDVK